MILSEIVKSCDCPSCGKRFEKQRRLFTTLNSFSSWRCSTCGRKLRFDRYSIFFLSAILTAIITFVLYAYLFLPGLTFWFRSFLLVITTLAIATLPTWAPIESPSDNLQGDVFNIQN